MGCSGAAALISARIRSRSAWGIIQPQPQTVGICRSSRASFLRRWQIWTLTVSTRGLSVRSAVQRVEGDRPRCPLARHQQRGASCASIAIRPNSSGKPKRSIMAAPCVHRTHSATTDFDVGEENCGSGWYYWAFVAPRAGFEPATIRLTVECSTAELPRNRRDLRVRKPGSV
jgi:hypothetical protein